MFYYILLHSFSNAAQHVVAFHQPKVKLVTYFQFLPPHFLSGPFLQKYILSSHWHTCVNVRDLFYPRRWALWYFSLLYSSSQPIPSSSQGPSGSLSLQRINGFPQCGVSVNMLNSLP